MITYRREEENGLCKHSATMASPTPESGRSDFGQQFLGDSEGTLLVFRAKGIGSIALQKNVCRAPNPATANSFRSKAHLYGVSERPGTLSERIMLLEPESLELWVGRSRERLTPLVPGRRRYRLFTASTTAVAVIPSSLITVPPGALRPKRSIPSTLPFSPTYFHQRPVTPASIATRFLQVRGRISSR